MPSKKRHAEAVVEATRHAANVRGTHGEDSDQYGAAFGAAVTARDAAYEAGATDIDIVNAAYPRR